MSRRRSVLDGGGGGQEEGLDVEYSFFRKVAGLPRRFSLATLAAATDEFGCVVGRGSSGTVFRGVLDDGTAVAVKRMDGGPSARLAEREFRAEAGAIGGAQHAGLVRLLGFCVVPHGGPRFLVYEFMEHGSLDKWIGGSNHRWLTWRQRRQVAVDVARALAYLHGDLRGGTKVVHLDVKPENILLDDAFRGVLSDFGLSTLMGKDQSRVVTTVRGTTGYLAPEWLLGAGVTDKSDVYSFGMVLMEMLGGRRNLQIIEEAGEVVVEGSSSSSRRRRWSYFPKIVAEKVREGRVMEVVDPRVREEAAAADEAGVRRVAHVALWCAQEKASARPDMARVVEMLEARGGAATEVEPPPPSEMILVDVLALDPDRAPRPFGLPPVPSSGWNTGVSSSAMSRSDSFALSYLSGR
ncbi:hypothetical protein PR202_gb17935 [Eleusine coracana subsp. coracana]|uniref:Protein kinase domain-containing protein n=1 Tax=Eleusine coracana subsp. coracana TaxID=191504 RepID=A0AAV5F5U1_ELECO|nr:hypothetical protein PR202_gb17935 [Eleusine coracana subsp. coracana]